MTKDHSDRPNPSNRLLLIVFALIVTIAVVIRIIVIRSPGAPSSGWIDLKIYRSAAALTNAGVNPFDSNKVLTNTTAEAIRTDPRYFDPFASDPARWSSYVSDNPPLSVLYWSVLEWVGRGKARAFLIVFALMDVVIYALAISIQKHIAGRLRLRDLFGIACLTVFNPMMVWWGTWFPEDKQLQTAIVLGLLLLINTSRYFLLGLVSSCVVLFKAVGLPLVVVATYRVLRNKNWRSVGSFAGGGFVPLLVSIAVFGLMFVEPMVSRLTARSEVVGPIRDSMWVAIPSGHDYRLIAMLAFIAVGILWALMSVAPEWRWSFVALWVSLALVTIQLSTGSWDRQLMGLIPVYVVTYAAIERARPWIVAQAVLVSWLYLWWAWLGSRVGPTPVVATCERGGTCPDSGPLSSLLSILLLFLTAAAFVIADPRTIPTLRTGAKLIPTWIRGAREPSDSDNGECLRAPNSGDVDGSQADCTDDRQSR